ncbi:MAG: hypothetical protein BAJALOKI1v1_550016 [Promethearchaeota archaeon]|nr:MAG: hypothetical protein BAJALOKI1v1_550016 [Candidatus Lokiarchaeota archaeon]
MPYEFLLNNLPKTKKAIGVDKGLAKIGDGIVNLTYSVAKSMYLTKNHNSNKAIRTGQKVSKAILAAALKNANMKEFAKNRANAHDFANTVEAVIAYAWLNNTISIKQLIDTLFTNLSGNVIGRFEEIENAAFAFTQVLLTIKSSLPEKPL